MLPYKNKLKLIFSPVCHWWSVRYRSTKAINQINVYWIPLITRCLLCVFFENANSNRATQSARFVLGVVLNRFPSLAVFQHYLSCCLADLNLSQLYLIHVWLTSLLRSNYLYLCCVYPSRHNARYSIQAILGDCSLHKTVSFFPS